MLRRYRPRLLQQVSAFTLPELLVTTVILGVTAAVGIQAFFFLVRRARVQSVALEVAGWLEQVRNAAADQVSPNDQAGGCVVTIVTGNLTAGQQLASANADCDVPDQEPADQPRTLLVPLEVQQDSVTLAVAGSNPFTFTPRGMWIEGDGLGDNGANPGQAFQLTISLNNDLPVRCVRLSPVLGSVEIGRPPNSASAVCDNWQTL